MYRKRAMKILITVILSFSIIISCSFSCFAARTFFEVDSSDWILSSEIAVGRYPDQMPSGTSFHESVYQHSELNGDCFVFSNDWTQVDMIREIEFYFPEFPEHFAPAGRQSNLVLNAGDFFFLYQYDSAHIYNVCYYDDDPAYFGFRTGSVASYYKVFRCSYPFDSWEPFQTISVSAFGEAHVSFPVPVSITFSDTPIYDFLSSSDNFMVWYFEGIYKLQEQEFFYKLKKPLDVCQGSMYLSVPASEVKKLSKKSTAFILENFGYICGTETDFMSFFYHATLRVNGEYYGSAEFVEYSYVGFWNDNYHPVGYAYISDYSDDVDFSELDLTNSDTEVDILISFVYYSTGYVLVFPGTFKIVDYSDYASEQLNQNVINKIDSSAGQITTSIGNAVTDISGSISASTSAITGAVGEVDSTLEYIKSGDIEIEQPDMNTAELDEVVKEQDKIIFDILSSLNVSVSEVLPPGYKNYSEYLIDNIKSFQSEEYNNTFNFIRSTFENLVASLSIMPLLLFSLSFGFAVFALGRRLR